MIGMSATTGQVLSGIEHLRQSIRDILTTRLGTRLMMPEYGSNIPNLIDEPLNDLTKSRILAATAGALAKLEPRINVTRVKVAAHEVGKIVIDLEGVYNGNATTLAGIAL
jgi:phage baseplate assembly protein W